MTLRMTSQYKGFDGVSLFPFVHFLAPFLGTFFIGSCMAFLSFFERSSADIVFFH